MNFRIEEADGYLCLFIKALDYLWKHRKRDCQNNCESGDKKRDKNVARAAMHGIEGIRLFKSGWPTRKTGGSFI